MAMPSCRDARDPRVRCAARDRERELRDEHRPRATPTGHDPVRSFTITSYVALGFAFSLLRLTPIDIRADTRAGVAVWSRALRPTPRASDPTATCRQKTLHGAWTHTAHTTHALRTSHTLHTHGNEDYLSVRAAGAASRRCLCIDIPPHLPIARPSLTHVTLSGLGKRCGLAALL